MSDKGAAASGTMTIKSMDELKGIIAEAVKGMSIPQIEALKEEIVKVNRAAMFPSGDGEIFETSGKSIVDLGYYQKQASLRSPGLGGSMIADDRLLGAKIRGMGGPWLSLSPTMMKFAKICAVGGDFQKAQALGVNIPEFNHEVRESYKKAFGEKATDFLSTTDAGALVPTEFMAVVVEFATAQSAILGKLWRIPMSTLTLKVPKLVQAAGSYFGGILLYHPGEGLEKTLTKPSFDSLTFTAKKLIGLITLSDELIGDSAINIVNYITGLFIRAFQYKTEAEVIAGTGLSNEMLGILKDTSINLVARQTVGTVEFKDLLNLESALDENFTNLTFLSRRATVNILRGQKDSAGQPVYHDGFSSMFGGPIPPQLLGYPLIKTRNVPALGSEGDLVLGDLGFYLWAMRQEMTIDSSTEWRFNYDQTAIRFVVRQDGAPGVSEAFAALDNVPES